MTPSGGCVSLAPPGVMDLKLLLQSKLAQRFALADWYRSVFELAAEGGV